MQVSNGWNFYLLFLATFVRSKSKLHLYLLQTCYVVSINTISQLWLLLEVLYTGTLHKQLLQINIKQIMRLETT